MKKIIILLCSCFLATSVYSQDFAGVSTADTLRIMNSVTHIQNDSQKNVWIGYELDAENAYIPKVALWNGTDLKIYSEEDGLEFGVVRSVLPSKEGHVWLVTATGVRKLMQDGSYTDYPLPQENEEGFRIIDNGKNRNMVEDGAGTLYCSTSLFAQKDIYNKYFNTLKQYEVWKLVGGNWIKSELKGADNSTGYNLLNDPRGGVILSYYDITLDNRGNKLLIFNPNTNEEEEYQFKDFLQGRVEVQASAITAYENKIVVSYKPLDAGELYEGFSVLNRDTKLWFHYGTALYKKSNPDLDFKPLLSAVYEDSGNLFSPTNFALKITPALDKGFWLSMQEDAKQDWLIEKGGGLIYCDGDEKFIRYSPGTHEGIEPFRPSKELAHSSDGRDYNKVAWRYGTGVAYDRSGNLFVGALDGGLWIIPKSVLPQSNTSSVAETSNSNKFFIIPNIVSSGETVKVSLPNDFSSNISSIIVSDQTGRTISTYNPEQLSANMKFTISTEGLSHGIYYVNMTIDNVSRTEKFIIK